MQCVETMKKFNHYELGFHGNSKENFPWEKWQSWTYDSLCPSSNFLIRFEKLKK